MSDVSPIQKPTKKEHIKQAKLLLHDVSRRMYILKLAAREAEGGDLPDGDFASDVETVFNDIKRDVDEAITAINHAETGGAI